jgi:Arc/MetJ-type ribon-helix-helix transcriptional regulator
MRKRVYVSFKVPEELLREMDRWVERGWFKSRSELIRFALIFFLVELKKREREWVLAMH